MDSHPIQKGVEILLVVRNRDIKALVTCPDAHSTLTFHLTYIYMSTSFSAAHLSCNAAMTLSDLPE